MRVLIVAHDFPPLNTSAARRPYAWARCWTELGHKIHVLTTAKYGFEGACDFDEPFNGFAVSEVHYLPFFRRAGRGPSALQRAAGITRADRLRRSTRTLRQKLGLFLDPASVAFAPLLRAALRLVRSRQFDAVVTTTGPDVCAWVGWALTMRSGIPWVADYRDLWHPEFSVQRSQLIARFTGWMHRRLLRRATAVCTVSEGLASRLRTVTDKPVWVSYNGYLEHENLRPRFWNDGLRHLVYTGRFYPGKRDPGALFAAVAELLAADAAAARLLQVDLFSPAEPWLRAQIASYGVESVVRLHGLVPHRESLAVQAGADALLFLDWMDPSAEGVLTSKLFEYLASGRPILCIGSRTDSEAARILSDCGAGRVAVDRAGVRQALREVAWGRFGSDQCRRGIERFSRRRQAEELIEKIQNAVGA